MYKLNFIGVAFLVLAILVLADVFGGTDFQRGVLGLLVLLYSDAANYSVEGDESWLKIATAIVLFGGLAVSIWGFVLVFSGLA